MKVIAINGSPKAEGNTYHALNMVGAELQAAGIEFEIIQVGHEAVHGCMACGKCAVNKDEKCVITSDCVNAVIQKVKNADGIILGSPVYYSGIAGTMKSFLDRMFYVSGANGGFFRHKAGLSVCAVRRSGGSSTFDSLNHYLAYSEMILATGNYWNIIHGRAPGDVEKDDEGKQTMRMLGKNMAWILKLIENGKGHVEEPAKEQKVFTHFIR
jgi:multimeric flavodoxin WrbA